VKNNKIILKSWFLIVALMFSCKLVAIDSKIIKYTCDQNNTVLLSEEGKVCSYKVSDSVNYLLLDKVKLGVANDDLSHQRDSSVFEAKENKHIALLVPDKKKLLVDFNGFNTSKITSKDVEIKDVSCIVNDCVSFLDVCQKITNMYRRKQEFKTLDDSVIYCNYIMSEILTVLKQNQTPLFLPILIPAIAKLEKTRELLPLAYVKSIEYSCNDPNELVFGLTIIKMGDRISPIQELSRESYLSMITTNLIQDRARYQINLNTGRSVFDLTTSDGFEVSIKEDLLSLHF
jgi:hypothetical protein